MGYYDNETADSIQSEMLSNVSDDYDKGIGYPAHDMLKSVAIEIANLYTALSDTRATIESPDNLSGEDLDKFIYQRKGVIRKTGAYADVILTVTGTGTINIGDIFETQAGLQYQAIETAAITNTGTVHVEAVEIGADYNTPANTITQIPTTLDGIVSVTNISAVTNGVDIETDDSFRERYYTALENPIVSNNENAFVYWAESITGVGHAKCFGAYPDKNNVLLYICNSDMDIADSNLIQTVQNAIDPKGVQDSEGNWSTWGKGKGLASAGSFCTVQSVTASAINIAAIIVKDPSYTDEEIKQATEDYISGYFASIALDEKNAYVSYGKISNLIFNVPGVQDYSNLTINAGNSNISLSLMTESCQIPVLGTVTLTDA